MYKVKIIFLLASVLILLAALASCAKETDTRKSDSSTVSGMTTSIASDTIDVQINKSEEAVYGETFGVAEYSTENYKFTLRHTKADDENESIKGHIDVYGKDNDFISGVTFKDIQEDIDSQFFAIPLDSDDYVIMYINELGHGQYNGVYAAYFNGSELKKVDFPYCDNHEHLCYDGMFDIEWDTNIDDGFTLIPNGFEPKKFKVDKELFEELQMQPFSEFDKNGENEPYLEELIFEKADEKSGKLHMYAKLTFGAYHAGHFTDVMLEFDFNKEKCEYTIENIKYL